MLNVYVHATRKVAASCCQEFLPLDIAISPIDEFCGSSAVRKEYWFKVLRRGEHLWWVDDGTEPVHIEHAQVGDGEGSPCELVRLQLIGPSLGSQLPHLRPKCRASRSNALSQHSADWPWSKHPL